MEAAIHLTGGSLPGRILQRRRRRRHRQWAALKVGPTVSTLISATSNLASDDEQRESCLLSADFACLRYLASVRIASDRFIRDDKNENVCASVLVCVCGLFKKKRFHLFNLPTNEKRCCH